MNVRFCGHLSVLVVLALGNACKADPTASDAGTPSAVLVSQSPILFDSGQSKRISAGVVDKLLTPLSDAVTASSTNPAVASVVPDPTLPDPTGTHSFFTVRGAASGQTTVTFTGGGVSAPTCVSVKPSVFLGAISKATAKGGDTITIGVSQGFKFLPESAAVSFQGQAGVVVLATADSLRVLVPYTAAGPVTVNGSGLCGVATVSLTSVSTVTQVGDLWAADSAWKTAPDITPMLPASGGTTAMIVGLPATNNASVCPEFVLGFGSSGPCMLFKFTVANTDTTKNRLSFTTSWSSGDGSGGNPDIDIYACSDSTPATFGTKCFEDGGLGATGVEPQSTGFHGYTPGTHYFVVEYFAACDASPATKCTTNGKTPSYYVTISRP